MLHYSMELVSHVSKISSLLPWPEQSLFCQMDRYVWEHRLDISNLLKQKCVGLILVKLKSCIFTALRQHVSINNHFFRVYHMLDNNFPY